MATPPSDVKAYIRQIGKFLLQEYEKKKYYTTDEVLEAHQHSDWHASFDYVSWAMSTFCSHEDFDIYHAKGDVHLGYAEMKAEMLVGISNSEGIDFSKITDADIDGSWLEFEDIFGGIFEGIGDFIGAILDGL